MESNPDYLFYFNQWTVQHMFSWNMKKWIFSFQYIFLYLGVVLLPMTFLSGTPVECTIHPTLWENMNNEPPDEDYEEYDYEDDVLDSIPKINDSINYVSKILSIHYFNEF